MIVRNTSRCRLFLLALVLFCAIDPPAFARSDPPPHPASGIIEADDFVLEHGEVLLIDGDLQINATGMIRIDGFILASPPIGRASPNGPSITLRAGTLIHLNGLIHPGDGAPGSEPGQSGGHGGSITIDAPLIVSAQQSIQAGSGGPGHVGHPGSNGGSGGDGGSCVVRGVILTRTGHPVRLLGGNGGRGGDGGGGDRQAMPGNGGHAGHGGHARADDPHAKKRGELALIPMSFAVSRDNAIGHGWPGAPGAFAFGGAGGFGGNGGDGIREFPDFPGGIGGNGGNGGEAVGGPGENGYPGRNACLDPMKDQRPQSGGEGGNGGDAGMAIGGRGGPSGSGGEGRPWGKPGRGGNGGKAFNHNAGAGGNGGDGFSPGHGGRPGIPQQVFGGDGGAGGGSGGSAIGGSPSAPGRTGKHCRE